MGMFPVTLSIVPRVVFDLRDWYASTFAAPQLADPTSATGFSRSIARVSGTPLFLADASNPRDPKWPFPQAVELVTRESGGVRAFHGRVKTTAGVQLNKTDRKLVSTAKCLLTIRARGYLPHTQELQIPGIDSEPLLVEPIVLFPAADYPFLTSRHPHALVEGAVRNPDGSGIEGVTVTPVDPRTGPAVPFIATRTAPDGRFLVVLDALLDEKGTTEFASVDIDIAHPAGAVRRTIIFVPVETVRPNVLPTEAGRFVPDERSLIPSTVLSGTVTRSGRPVAGAPISISSPDEPLLTGTVNTDQRGSWTFYGDARLPLTGQAEADITVIANGQPATVSQIINFGQRNSVLPV
jgi:hypothetical protein